MSRPSLSVRGAGSTPKAVVLVLPGGRAKSRAPARRRHLSALRMRPFARDIHRAGAGSLAVWTLKYRLRGWNGPDASPLPDAQWALDRVRAQHGEVPVILVGHSMGGRVALRLAGDRSVCAVVALAPWIPAGEPVADLRGRDLLILHGDRDHTTDPQASLAYAEAAAAVTDVRRVLITGSGHSMLKRSEVWQGVTTYFVLEQSHVTQHGGVLDQSAGSAAANHQYRISETGVHLQL
jgi:pimeloyl-ACP methyl ester carboxylesterase